MSIVTSGSADSHTDCSTPQNAAAVFFDVLLMVIASVCLFIVCYGLYKYVQFWRKNRDDYLRPPRYIHRAGLVFFCISLLTLVNALLYDVFLLVCHELDTYERSLYHIIYFAQIYSLWIILFFRVHFIFSNTAFRLSRCVLFSYGSCFVMVPLLLIGSLAWWGFESEAFVTLPYIVMSSAMCTSLLVTFLRKLLQLFCHMRVDKDVVQTATKNTLLASISIMCSFLVIAVLVGLYVRHDGNIQQHSVMEELVLELAILIDIVSNFICVLLTYKFFGKQYYALCGPLDKKFEGCIRDRVVKHANLSDAERTLSEIVSGYRDGRLDRGRTLSVNRSAVSGNVPTATTSSAASSKPSARDQSEVAIERGEAVDRERNQGDNDHEETAIVVDEAPVVGHATASPDIAARILAATAKFERYHSLADVPEQATRRPGLRMAMSNPVVRARNKQNKFFHKSNNSK